jgi:hypothetical protein
MTQQKVLMHVRPDGTTKIEAQGYEGGTCLDATAPFENMFQKQEQARVMTGDCGPTPDMGERVR